MRDFVKWLIPVLFLVGILIATVTTYNKLLEAVNYKPYSLDSSFVSKEYIVNDIHNTKIKKLTDELNTYTYRVDSINSIVKKLDSQYVSTIDMMIDKLNTWIGLWMGILTLVLGLVSVWQYFKINKYEERITKLETMYNRSLKELNEKETKLDMKYSQNKEKMHNDLSKYIRQMSEDLQKRSKEHRYSTLENRITSLLLCLSSIPDPQLLYSSSDRKSQLAFYMRLMSKYFAKYICLIKKEYHKNEMPEDIAMHLPMMLLNLRLALIRIHGISTDFELHVFFFNITKKIKNVEDFVIDKAMINDEIIKNIENIYGDFNELINMIEIKSE